MGILERALKKRAELRNERNKPHLTKFERDHIDKIKDVSLVEVNKDTEVKQEVVENEEVTVTVVESETVKETVEVVVNDEIKQVVQLLKSRGIDNDKIKKIIKTRFGVDYDF